MVLYCCLSSFLSGEYHKYDTIVYPKKTKSWTEKFSELFSFRTKQSGDSKEEEELTPMGFYNMSIFCLQCYLSKYENMVYKGMFQQGSSIVPDADRVAHIFHSLKTVHLRTVSAFFESSVDVEVPNLNKYRQVCSFICLVYTS